MSQIRTHYDNLKVARDAPDFVIRAAYRTLSQKYHPDKHPGDARAVRVMAIINQSYEVLSDPERRREHDAWIVREELRLKRETQAQSPPIPPQWQQPQQSAQAMPQGSKAGRWLIGLLLLPLKLVVWLFLAVPQLAVPALILGGLWVWAVLTPDRPRQPPPSGPKPYQAAAPTPSASKLRVPTYIRPAVAPNGSPWPARAAYVGGYPIDNDDGRSNVTVDNTQNDSDVFVKLVSLDGATAYPVRQFYIPARSKFTMDEVTAGTYDIRYRDLVTGGLSRSESFDVEEERTDSGVQYSEMTMTLYKVQGGNFQTYDLGADEF